MTYTSDQIRRIVWAAIWRTTGHAPTPDNYDYWDTQGKFQECADRGDQIHDPDYAVKRLEGWQASATDAPPFGPYAQPPQPYWTGTIPPYPGDAPAPAPSPTPAPAPTVDLAPVLSALAALTAKVDALAGKPAPEYRTSAFGIPIVLRPQPPQP